MAAFTPTDITYFPTPAALGKWFAKNATSAEQLWLGFYKVGSGTSSITWPQSVDEALCVGWIDGIRKSVDGTRYVIRFTPRKTTSVWSVVNINRVKVLTETGRMQPAGLAAFAARKVHKSGIYAFEQESPELSASDERMFKKHKAAWTFFQAQPPYYRHRMNWYVISPKREETREKRLQLLIEASADGRRL